MMRKVCIGYDHRFRWAPPDPYEMQVTDPTLTVHWPGGQETYTLTFPGYAEVTAISDDRRTLTVTWSAGAWDMGDPAPVAARVAAAELGQVNVRVVRLSDGDQVELESPLPDAITAVGAVLRALVCAVTIPLADVPATPVRPVRFSVEYASLTGGSTSIIDRLDMGVLAVVRHPFSTGLVDGELTRIAGWTRNAYPAGQSGLGDAISSSLDTLIGHIRHRRPDLYEDQLAGPQFRRAHAILAQLAILDEYIARGQDRGAARDRLAAELDAELDRVFAALEWVDANDDGEADDTQAAGGIVGGMGIADSALCDTSADEDAQPVTYTRIGMGDDR